MNVFREVSKRISPYMRSKGFLLAGKSYYYIVNDIACCIGFDAPSGLLYVTAYIMPLFVPCECKYYTYGKRFNEIKCLEFPTLSKKDNQTAIDIWCQTLCKHIDDHILPFFEKIDSPHKLMEHINLRHSTTDGQPICHDVYIWRLKMYTHLFMGDYVKVNDAIASYRDVLCNVTFLSGLVQKKYREEIDEVESMIKKTREQINKYCLDIVANTRKILQ